MKDVQTLIGQSVNNAVKGTPTSYEDRRKEQFNESTLKLVILLFTRLADLFGSKCNQRGLVIYDSEYDEERGVYSEALRLWCRKLNDLTADNFKTGMSGLETKAEYAYREGEEMWPPSYAEFRALAFPHADRDLMAHKVLPRLPALEDQTAKERRIEEGRKRSQELLAMFETEPPKPPTPEDIKDLERVNKLKAEM